MAARTIPVLEIGGTHVTAALVDTGSWRVVGNAHRTALDAAGTAEEIVATVLDAARSKRPHAGSPWGVALPGPFHYSRGVADYHGVGKFDALRGFDLGDTLRRHLTGGTGEVHFLNDAEAFAVGEWLAGAAQGCRRMIGVTLGTGVGSAFLIDGLGQRRGPGVPPDGRLDLLEIDGRPLEDTVSRRAILARYAALTRATADEPVDVRDIASRARSGDVGAGLAITGPLRALGRVLAPSAALFGADVVVVGGSISLAWDVIEAPLRDGMSEATTGGSVAFTLAPAQRTAEAALLGAAWHAVQSAEPARPGG